MNQSVLQILVQLKDEASAALQGMVGSLDKYKASFQEVGIIGTAMLGSVSAVAYKGIKDYSEAEAASRQLENAVLNVTKGTREQLAATMDLASALEKKGVLDGDAIAMGAAQLSTFGLTNKSVRDLMGSMADLAVNQYGVGASSEQLVDSANILAKALNGQYGILEKSGIRFTDAQKKIIDFGTEEEKVAAVNDVMAKNLRYTNDVAKQTAEGGIAALKVQMGNLSESIGATLAPALGDLLKSMQPMIESFSKWVSNNPKLTLTILGVVGGLGGLLMVVGAIGLAIPAIVGGFTALATAGGALGAALLSITWPIALIAAGLALLVAGVILVIQNWDAIKAKTLEVWGAVTEFLKTTWDSITQTVTSVWNGIKDFFSGVWDAIKTIFMFAAQLAVGAVIGIFSVFGIDIVAVFTKIKLYFDVIWTAIKLVFNTALEWIKNTWNSVWGAISNFIGPIWDSIKNTISDSWNFILGKFAEFVEPLNKAWTNLWSGVGNTLTIVWEGVKTTIKNSINWILEKVNSVIRALNSVAAKGAGAFGAKSISIPEIPLLAAGGIVNQPTLAMIGEAGPEAVIPLNRMNGFGSGSMIFYTTISGNNIGNAMDLKNICNQVEEAIMNKVRRNAMVSL